MPIPDNELFAEIQADIDAGLGARLIMRRLNLPGGASVPKWVVSINDAAVDKEQFLQELSLVEAGALQTLMDSGSPAGQALRFKLGQSTTIDMSKAPNRVFVAALEVEGAISSETATNLLRLGEVKESRAQELWGEPASIEQVKTVIGGA